MTKPGTEGLFVVQPLTRDWFCALAPHRTILPGLTLDALYAAAAGDSLLSRSEVRLCHDFQQRCSCAIQVNACLVAKNVVNGFARIFLKMCSRNADWAQAAILKRHFEQRLADNRRKELADLIALG